MRKVIVMMSVSLDGFVADEDHDVDWMFPRLDDAAEDWAVALLRRTGTQLIGRVNYEEQAAHWPKQTGRIAELVNAASKIVFSHSLESLSWNNSRLADLDPADEIARLREQPGGDIFVPGGASFVQELSSAGLVDEYRLIVHPVVLGGGLPLFADPVTLKLVETTTFATGAVALCYQPAG